MQASKEIEKVTCFWINLALNRHFVFGFEGGRDDDRYCSASLRHVPLVIPVDTPPTYREPGKCLTESFNY